MRHALDPIASTPRRADLHQTETKPTTTPDRRPPPGTTGSGRAIVSFQGVINFSEILAPTSRPYN